MYVHTLLWAPIINKEEKKMPRLNPINPAEAQGKVKELLDIVQKNRGAMPNIFKTMAHAPAALEGLINLQGALKEGAVHPQFRERLALTIAGINGCDYCASAHTFLGREVDLDQTELEANLQGKSANAMCQAGLNFVTKLVNEHGQVSKSDLQAVRDAGFSDERIIEIIALVAANIFTNYFNLVFKPDIDFPEVISTKNAHVNKL